MAKTEEYMNCPSAVVGCYTKDCSKCSVKRQYQDYFENLNKKMMETKKEGNCKVCGAPIESGYAFSNEMFEKQLCFSCHFWNEKYEIDQKRKPHTFAVINGSHYYLEPSKKYGMLGMCGINHKIRFADGFETECNNLWHQGEIPEAWKDKFPNNAEFVNK